VLRACHVLLVLTAVEIDCDDVGYEGRTPVTHGLGLVEAGVMLDDAGYIVGNNEGDRERSTVRNIYAIGDVLKVRVCSNDNATDVDNRHSQ